MDRKDRALSLWRLHIELPASEVGLVGLRGVDRCGLRRSAGMDETVEHSYWWVPGSPNTRVHDALSFDPIDGASLTLLDPLPDVRASRFNVPTLLGETFDGRPLTLLHPFVTGTSDRTTPTEWRSSSTIVSSTVLRGYHLESPDAPVISRAILRFAGLRDVCLQEWPNDKDEWVPFIGPGLLAKQAELDGGTVLFR